MTVREILKILEHISVDIFVYKKLDLRDKGDQWESSKI